MNKPERLLSSFGERSHKGRRGWPDIDMANIGESTETKDVDLAHVHNPSNTNKDLCRNCI